MSSQRKTLILGIGAIVAGSALALVLSARGSGQTDDAAGPGPDAANKARSLAKLNDEPTPEEYDGAKEYMNDRFGHLGEDVEAMVSTDASGERFYLLPTIWVGRGANGKKQYLRAIAQPRTSDKLRKVSLDGVLDQFPLIRASGYEPPPVLERLKNMKTRIEPGDELPPELGGGPSPGAWKLPPKTSTGQ